ncbi:hypothetical protein [Saccharopolyspora sp. ASAGF58]|uniref:hypothetical protein n=1 Tax=Saccharopolyspora sp. ASAGF58 TaxID=2719023 RepID=UPI001FF084C7
MVRRRPPTPEPAGLQVDFSGRATGFDPAASLSARRETKLTEEHERVAGGVVRAMSIGVVDEVIDPKSTRRRVAEALAAAPAGRGWHGNIPL